MTKSYKNAICLPCRGCENKALYPNASGGVFDHNKQPIRSGFLYREYRKDVKLNEGVWEKTSGLELKTHELILPGTISVTKSVLPGRYIFAGYLFPHYGHFLLESLANLWYFKQHPEVPIIWLGVHNQPDLNSVNRQFIELFNIKNTIHILTEQTEVEELIVPEPGYRIHTRYTKDQVQALKVLDTVEPKKGKKIWLSRSGLEDGGVDNEHLLETVLAQAGWIIYHPEDHNINDQLHMLSNAEHVAGIEGSAFHTFMMLPDFKGKIHIFARRSKLEFDFIAIAETLGFDQKAYYPASKVWSHELPHWSWNRYWLRIAPILSALNEVRSTNSPQPPPGNLKKVIKGLMDHFGTHLLVELWANKRIVGNIGTNRQTVSVSTDLDIDTTKLHRNIDHLDITADQFFTSKLLNVNPDTYCFRHNANEQTLIRAFNSSQHMAKSTTLWIIEYNATERAVSDGNRSKFADRSTSANHKLLHYIDTCCPMITVARLRGANLAIAWQQPKQMHKPHLEKFSHFDTIDKFSRCPVRTLDEIAADLKNHVFTT